MTIAGFKARNHPQQIRVNGPRHDIDDRATDPALFARLHQRFNFTLDAAALPHNAKLPRYFTPEDNGLEQSWAGERVWCNPPYSDIPTWLEKAWDEVGHAALIVMLLPANRTEQGWWQEFVEAYRDGRTPDGPRVEFIAGRQRFIAAGATGIGPNERPPFGCCLLIWDRCRP